MPQVHLQGTQSLIQKVVPHSWEFDRATILCAMILQAKMIVNNIKVKMAMG